MEKRYLLAVPVLCGRIVDICRGRSPRAGCTLCRIRQRRHTVARSTLFVGAAHQQGRMACLLAPQAPRRLRRRFLQLTLRSWLQLDLTGLPSSGRQYARSTANHLGSHLEFLTLELLELIALFLAENILGFRFLVFADLLELFGILRPIDTPCSTILEQLFSFLDSILFYFLELLLLLITDFQFFDDGRILPDSLTLHLQGNLVQPRLLFRLQ